MSETSQHASCPELAAEQKKESIYPLVIRIGHFLNQGDVSKNVYSSRKFALTLCGEDEKEQEPPTLEMLQNYICRINDMSWCFVHVGCRVAWHILIQDKLGLVQYGIVRETRKDDRVAVVEVVPRRVIETLDDNTTTEPMWDSPSGELHLVEPCLLHVIPTGTYCLFTTTKMRM